MKNNQLQLLVCTANLGNAQPDEDSLAAWIPPDGRCTAVLKYPAKYPVRDQFSTFDEYSPNDRFDIIVIGMQEATFDPPSLTPASDDINGQAPAGAAGHHRMQSVSEHMDSSTHSMASMPAMTTLGTSVSAGPSVTSRRSKKKTSSITKSINHLTSYTASRDYTKKPGSINSTARSHSIATAGSNATGNSKANAAGGATTDPTSSAHAAAFMAMVDANWDLGTAILHEMLEKRLRSYDRMVSFQRGQMRLEVFVLRNTELTTNPLRVEVHYTKAQNTGIAGLANKGGIVTELIVNDFTRLSFLTAHLEAHEGTTKYQMRCASLADILGGAKPSNVLHDASLTSHYCFVLGDLNFRTEMPEYVDGTALAAAIAAGGGEKDIEEEHKQRIRDMVSAQDWDSLNQVDELHRALRRKDCLVGFQTLHCNFPPTFKVHREPGYKYITKRRPSYTDRILWKENHMLEKCVRPYVYEPIDQFQSSDHKPVRAAFGIPLNEAPRKRQNMARRRSAIQMAGEFLHTVKGAHASSGGATAHRARLHIFLSEISCHLDASSSNLPSPYICIVTTPPEAVQTHQTLWKRWKKTIPSFLRGKSDDDDEVLRTPQGWPRSSIQNKTAQPDWQEEEFRTEIRTFYPDGTALDLTGAMIRFTVMDSKSSRGTGTETDVVLGTFAYNLGQMLKSFRPPTEEQPLNSSLQRRGSIFGMFRRASSGHFNTSQSELFPSSGGNFSLPASSNINNRQTSGGSRGAAAAQEESEPVKTIKIDAPLVKNGMERGRIRFTMDAWWMTENTAKALLGPTMTTTNQMGPTSVTHSMVMRIARAATLRSATSNGTNSGGGGGGRGGANGGYPEVIEGGGEPIFSQRREGRNSQRIHGRNSQRQPMRNSQLQSQGSNSVLNQRRELPSARSLVGGKEESHRNVRR